MSEPLVSVLIPVYNHARYVRQCLDSLLREGWSNLEVLVIDDGSSDNSADVVRGWRKENPYAFTRFEFYYQTNQGITRTLNFLVRMARGEYITLVASDDYLMSSGILARVTSLQSNPHLLGVAGETWIVNSDDEVINKSGALTFNKRPRWVFDQSQTLRRELLVRWWFPGPSLLLRKIAFDPIRGVGLYDESISFEDRDYYLRLIANNQLGFIHYPVAAYRVDLARLASPPPLRLLWDEVRSEEKNKHRFNQFEQFLLSLRSKRTRAKLALREPPRKWSKKLNLVYMNLLWAIVLIYHRLYITLKHVGNKI